MGLWTDYEVKISRRAKRTGLRGWTRRAIFMQVPTATAESLVPPEHSDWPGESGNFAAKLVDSDIEPEAEPGASSVYLYYRPLSWDEWLEANPNHGILMGSASVSSRKVTRLPDGTMLEGRDPSDSSGRTYYGVKSGRNVEFFGQAVYEIYAVISNRDVFFFQYASAVGTYNATPMMGLPLYPLASRVGQWMLIGLSCVPRIAKERLWTMKYRFLLHDRPDEVDGSGRCGWAIPCVSGKYVVEAVEIPVTDEDGDPAGTQYVASLVDQGEDNTVNLVRSTNFLAVEQLMLNSW